MILKARSSRAPKRLEVRRAVFQGYFTFPQPSVCSYRTQALVLSLPPVYSSIRLPSHKIRLINLCSGTTGKPQDRVPVYIIVMAESLCFALPGCGYTSMNGLSQPRIGMRRPSFAIPSIFHYADHYIISHIRLIAYEGKSDAVQYTIAVIETP